MVIYGLTQIDGFFADQMFIRKYKGSFMKINPLLLIVLSVIAISATACNSQATPTTIPVTPETKTQENSRSPVEPTFAVPDLNLTGSSGGVEAPQVIKRIPEIDEVAQPDRQVELYFNQKMDADSVKAAFHLKKDDGADLAGKLTWLAPDHLAFIPEQSLEKGAYYQVILDESAKSAGSLPMEQAYMFRFKTITPLTVSQVFPADGVEGVAVNSPVTVMFNLPVVEMTTLEDQSTLSQPIQFSPDLAGTGEWVNTSTYVFHPESQLASGTRYQVTIPAGLKEASGDAELKLAVDKSWQFTTLKPTVMALEVDEGEYNLADLKPAGEIGLLPKIGVSFSQAMDQASVNKALTLSDAGSRPVAVNFKWNGDSRKVLITPLEMLSLSSTYKLSLATSALAADGGALGQPLKWSFTTIPAPRILSTEPIDGKKDQQFYYFSIRFISPMNKDSLIPRLKISPALDESDSQWIVTDNGRQASIYGLKPSTSYEVTVSPGILDIYGNALKEGKVIRFSTAPESPQLYLNMPSQPLYRQDTDQVFFTSSKNVSKIHTRIYKVEASELLGWRSMEEEWLDSHKPFSEYDYTPEGKSDEGLLNKIEIKNAAGEPLPPGAYYLGISSPDIKSKTPFLDGRFFIVTDTYLVFKNGPSDSLVWAVNPQTGEPVANLELEEYSIDENQKTNKIGSGKTDQNGLLHLTFDTVDQRDHYVVSGKGSPFAFASTNWYSDVTLDDFGIDNIYSGDEFNTLAYIYSDRPIYRPNQTVYFKGILRTDSDLAYRLPSQKDVEVVINSYDKEVYRKTLSVSNAGTFNGEFQLDQEAALGHYYLSVLDPDKKEEDRISYGSLGFDVAEYHKPEFQVDLQTTPGDVLLGKNFKALLEAKYYTGGSLNQAAIDWTLRAHPFIYTPPEEYSSYNFVNPASDEDWYASPYLSSGTREIAHGQAITDDNGKAELTIPAEISYSADSQVLNLEANLTDLSGNLVSSQANVIAHRSEVYAGIRSQNYLGKVGEEQTFNVVALDWDGKPVEKQTVSVAISERQWLNVQKMVAQGVLRWESNVKDIPAATVTQTTDEKGLATVSFTPAKGGTYRAVVTVYDKGGRVNHSAAYIWVSGKDYVSWRETNDRTFQLVTDRSSYKTGDQADIMIASPFQGEAYALLTVERAKVRQQEVLHLTNNSTVYHLPITEDMGPAVYISVTVVKGIDETNPNPAYRTGMTRIKVSTDRKVVQMKITPDRSTAGPGEKVVYNIQTLDADNKPVKAEVSLGLSDLASLSLADPNSAAIDQFFYGLRGLTIRTMLSYSASIEEYNVRLDEMASEGVGKGGAGKGEYMMGVMDVRQDFKDTAYWNAIVQTGEDGKASVTITLPDNLTTWRLDARAVTNDTLVGQTTVDIISSKKLLLRPQTPRFFIAGDQSQVSTAIHNDTGKEQVVAVSLKAEGLEIAGSAEQKVTISDGQQAMVNWKVSIPQDSQRVDLVFSAQAGDYSDSSTAPLGTLDHQGLPVYRYEAPETVGSSGEVDALVTRTEYIHLPDWADKATGNLKVQIEPSLAGGMFNSQKYLDSYPYETTEVDISRFISDITLLKVIKSGLQTEAGVQEKLEGRINTAIQRIYTRQNNDGGWGWWSSSQSDPMTSAYVLFGLAEAADYGIKVDVTVAKNGKNYLLNRLDELERDDKLPPTVLYNRQAFFNYVLACHSNYQTNVSDKLFKDRVYLSVYAKAFLAQTIWIQNAGDDRLQTLLSELAQSAVLSASGTSWQETTTDPWNWNTDVRTTAIVLNALVTIDPESELAVNGVRWLMHHRRNGCWFTTQENAWVLKSLALWSDVSGELKGNYAYAVAINGQSLDQGQVNNSNLSQTKDLVVDLQTLMRDQANQLKIGRSDGSGRLYYSTYMTISLPADQIKALDQGMSITRNYYRPSDMKNPITQASQGEILETELVITVPQSLHYVMISDSLPAGMESIDSSLKTSPQPVVPDGFDWSNMKQEGWGWWYFSHIEQRDEKVVLFADYLPAGKYVYHYRVRTVTPGLYRVIPTIGQEVYFPDVYGRSDGSLFTIQ